MRPTLPQFDLAHGWLAYSVVGGNHWLWSWIIPDRTNLLLSQFRCTLALMARKMWRRAVALFCSHVGIVVDASSHEQVIDIDARANIAVVTDAHAVRNWSALQFPCKPMNQDSAAIYVGLSMSLRTATSKPNLAATFGNAFATTFQKFGNRFFSCHDTPHRVIEDSPVSAVWAAWRLQPHVPAPAS